MKKTLTLVAVAAALAARAAVAQEAVPQSLQVAAGETLAATLHASGVQIYECRALKDAPGKYEWAFTAPEADLRDAQGKRIGTHYAGPHWEALDGSKVIGAVRQKADAPASKAIPWLLLSAKSVGAEGGFSRVISIQRVNTVGGTAPSADCAAANAGSTARVPYTADYHLYTMR
jgi:hypothetical protein